MKTSVWLAILFFACVSYGAELQTWTLADGTVFEARYNTVVAGNVIMESSAGEQKKIAMDRFSEKDIEFFELENPPEFRISFRRKSDQLQYSSRFVLEMLEMPVVLLYSFGVRVEKRSAGEYNHEVNVEYFAIGNQVGFKDKYILLDHQSFPFLPSKENNFEMEIWSPAVVSLDQYRYRDIEPRGKKYDSSLIVITDKRGKVIAVKSPNNRLFENIENLRKLSPGNYMDETCKRVYPGRPKAMKY